MFVPRINAVGVELEGSWDINTRIPRLVRDGSVHLDRRGWRMDTTNPGLGYGVDVPLDSMTNNDHAEWNSNPILEKKELLPLLKTNYPRWINETCGMHVHMSFAKRLYYLKLMDRRYQDHLFAALRDWAKAKGAEVFPKEHPIWGRLSGKNQYCLDEFKSKAQAKQPGKHYNRDTDDARYTAICYHWKRQQTIECRLLPMLPSPKLAEEAVMVVVNATGAFLVKALKEVEPTVKVDYKGKVGQNVRRRIVRLGRN